MTAKEALPSLSIGYVRQWLTDQQFKIVNVVSVANLRPGMLVVCRYIYDGTLNKIVLAIVVSIKYPPSEDNDASSFSFSQIKLTFLTMNNELISISRRTVTSVGVL